MRLSSLRPEFLTRIDDTHFGRSDTMDGSDGILFKCPKCTAANGGSFVGVHSVICWRPHVPQTTVPVPGRWEFVGTGPDDLTLVAGSSSIQLNGGCNWHGFIRNGEVTDA